MRKTIVIVGAGFGGLRTALGLAKKFSNSAEYEIILIDKNSYHTYTPSLYEVASAYRAAALRSIAAEIEFEEELAGSSCFVIRDVIKGKNIHFVQDEVTDLHLDAKRVVTKSGDKIDYSYLVIALGSEATFFGVEGAQTCCHTLKTLTDALNIRDDIENVIQHFAKRNKTYSLKQNTARLMIIGGGLSGVEVASEMAKYTKHLAGVYKVNNKYLDIKIIEAGPQILSSVPAPMRKRLEKRLKNLGVDILTGKRVKKVEPNKLYFEDGSSLRADFLFWAGGICGPQWLKRIEELPLDEKSGRILIDKFLRVRSYNTAFAIGDIAFFTLQDGSLQAPATAWAAEQQADALIYNITAALRGKRLVPYNVFFPGFISAAGGKYAVAHLYGFTFEGFGAWLLKRIIDLKYIWSLYSKWTGFKIWWRELGLFGGND